VNLAIAFNQKHIRLIAQPAVAQFHELLHPGVLQAGDYFDRHASHLSGERRKAHGEKSPRRLKN
jgi:hypothetical protein